MKLSEFAKKNSIKYQAAYNMFKAGLIKGHQLPTGTIVIDVEIIAIGDKEHCISKAYDDYNRWSSRQLTLDEIEQRLDENKLKKNSTTLYGVYIN